MFGVARRCVANHRRGVLRRLAATERLYAVVSRSVQQGEPDWPLHDALAVLNADDRELLTLTYWDGLNAEEAARVLSISASTARKRLQRARERLRAELGEGAALETVVADRGGPHRSAAVRVGHSLHGRP